MTPPVTAGIRAGIAVGLIMGLVLVSTGDVIPGVIGGVLSGVLFGVLFFAIVRGQLRGRAKLIEPYEAEGIVHHGPANCAIGPGYMILTKNRLVWLPAAESERATKRIEMTRTAIRGVGNGRGIGAQMEITVHTGERVEFLVRDRKAWIEHVKSVAHAPSATATAQ